MPRYLLDTNVVTELEDRQKPGFAAISAKLASLEDEDEVFLSILSAYEYQHGIAKAPPELKESLRKAWSAFEARFPMIGLSSRGAILFGEIKAEYQNRVSVSDRQLKRHTVDFILASSAVEHDAILVSGDGIFSVIRGFYPSLQTESWLPEEKS